MYGQIKDGKRCPKIDFAPLSMQVSEQIVGFYDGKLAYYPVYAKFIEWYQAGLMSLPELEVATLALQGAKTAIFEGCRGKTGGW